MTLANLHDRLANSKPNYSPELIKKSKPRKARGVNAFIVRFPSGAVLWTSAKLADRWDRRSGDLIHPSLINGTIAGRA
jgi:hypothetical protein